MKQQVIQSEQTHERGNLLLQLSAWAGIVGPLIFVLVFMVNGALHPTYSAMSQAVSYLAVQSNGWIQDLNFLVLGLLLLLFAIGFHQRMHTVMSRKQLTVCTILLVLVGAGFTNECFFTAGAAGEPQNAFHIIMHNIGFIDIFFSLPILFFICGAQFRKTPIWRGYGWYSIIAGLVTVALLAFFVYVGIQTSPFLGLVQRILIIEALAWYVVMSWRFLTLKKV
jgi:hypothetical protein